MYSEFCTKNYEDQFKLLLVIEENMADIFETHHNSVYYVRGLFNK